MIKMLNTPKSLSYLIVANLVPLAGAIFGGWSVGPIVAIFWFEGVVVGILNVLRMRKVNSKINLIIIFFILHYGGFLFGHGVFVLGLILTEFIDGQSIPMLGIIIGGVGIFLSHWSSYKKNFIANKEYEVVSEDILFVQPYKRIALLHVVVLATGFLIVEHQSPLWAVSLLVVVKIIFDARAHIKEHREFTRIDNLHANDTI